MYQIPLYMQAQTASWCQTHAVTFSFAFVKIHYILVRLRKLKLKMSGMQPNF